MTATLNRRELIAGAALAGIGLCSSLDNLWAGEQKRLYKIGACDWSIGQRGKLEAMDEAKRIGLEGVQVSFGPPGVDMDLRDEKVRQAYREASERTGVEIASLAMGVLNQRPYATDAEAEKWVEECIDVMAEMGQKIVLLAFFSNGDIKDKPDMQDAVIRRLKKVAPKAEAAGVVLAIESYLNADDHIRMLDGVGSPAVKVYYDVANMHYTGYDIYQDMRKLGADRICQVHAKERGCLLGKGPIDFVRVKQTLEAIGYYDWLIIEGATEKGRSMFDCYVDNQKFLRGLFPTAG